MRAVLLLVSVAVALCALPAAGQEVPYPTQTQVDAVARQKIDQARATVEANPASGEAWGRYGMILDAHKLRDVAETVYREAAKLGTDDARWPYFLAILLQAQDPASAVEWYERVIQLQPDYPPIKLRLGEALEAVGRDADAEVQYREAAQLDPSNPVAPLGLGRLALAGDRVEEAVEHLERAYGIDARIQAVVTTLARAYSRSGRDDLARQKVEEAAGLTPSLPFRDPLYTTMMQEAQLTALSLVDVEHPSLAEMEFAVREQLAASRDRLDAVQSQGRGVSAAALGRAYGDLGELYLVYDLTDAARACLTNASRLLKEDPRWAHLLGTSFEHDRELEEARRWYGNAATLDDTYLPTLLRFGKVALLLGKPDEASLALERARELDPNSAAATAWLGRAALGRSDTEAGVELLERALGLQPGATALHYELSQGYRTLGNATAADAHLAKRGDIAVSFPDPVAEEVRSRIVGLGAAAVMTQMALRNGDLIAAEAHARAAVVAEPTSAASHRLLAGVFATGGKFDDAVAAFERAVELDPQDVGLRLSMTRVLAETGRDGEIIELLEGALPLAPNHAELHAELGAALARQGRFEQAEVRLTEAARLDPEHDGVALLRASVYTRLERPEEATAELERLVDLSPDLAEARVLPGPPARRAGPPGPGDRTPGSSGREPDRHPRGPRASRRPAR